MAMPFDKLLGIMTPIATTTIAAAVAIIGLQQWRISREKLRLDLFNRRFDVYMRVLDLYQELLLWKGTDEQRSLFVPFIKAMRESRFIFPKKSGVYPFLEDCHKRAFYVIHYEEARDGLQGMPRELMAEAQKRVDTVNWILNSMATLEDKMEPYLSFKAM